MQTAFGGSPCQRQGRGMAASLTMHCVCSHMITRGARLQKAHLVHRGAETMVSTTRVIATGRPISLHAEIALCTSPDKSGTTTTAGQPLGLRLQPADLGSSLRLADLPQTALLHARSLGLGTCLSCARALRHLELHIDMPSLAQEHRTHSVIREGTPCLRCRAGCHHGTCDMPHTSSAMVKP